MQRAPTLADQFPDAVIIYGPQDCGKSLNASALAFSFGKVFILDHDVRIRPDQYPPDTIVFSSVEVPGAMPFDQAMQLAGLTHGEAQS